MIFTVPRWFTDFYYALLSKIVYNWYVCKPVFNVIFDKFFIFYAIDLKIKNYTV